MKAPEKPNDTSWLLQNPDYKLFLGTLAEMPREKAEEKMAEIAQNVGLSWFKRKRLETSLKEN